MAIPRKDRINIIKQILNKAYEAGWMSGDAPIEELAESMVDKVNISKYLASTSDRYDRKDVVKVTSVSNNCGRRTVRFTKKPHARPL